MYYLVHIPLYLYLGLVVVWHHLLLLPHMSWRDFGKGMSSMLTFMFIKNQIYQLGKRRKNGNRDGIAIISSIIGDGH